MNTTKVYIENAKAWLDNYRVIANKGGTRSGKTYSLMSLFVSICTGNKHKRVIDIVSESLPHLKRGALNDIESIINNLGLVEMRDYIYNRSDRIYIFKTGSRIRFYSSDDWWKVKGSSRDILFINECNRIGYEVYRQLAVRTRQCIFLDWNPDSEFWYETKGVQTKATTIEIHSTYKDNPYLTPEQIEEIESNKDDDNWWKVYGLGQTGRPQGVVFKNWEQCNEIPKDATLIGRGLDFGFSQDHTAIVDVYMYDGNLWLDEVCYKKGLTNDKIADILRGRDGWTVADSAEMKSITEIYNYGIRKIEPAEKGPDSIRNGIQIMQRYPLMVTSRSLNLIYELRNYRWKENKLTGELLNEPIDKYNHAIDACRYLITNKLAEKPKIKKPKAKLKDI